MFFNMAAWKAPAPHIQLIVTQNFTERATAERNDLLKLTRREQRGTIFNKPAARQPHRSTRNTALPLIRRARSSSAT